MQTQLETIQKLIANNQTYEALIVLLKLSRSKPEIENTVLSIMGEHNELLLHLNRGTLKSSESDRRKSQIRIKTLEMADMLFRLNNTQTVSLQGNQLLIKEKKLNSIRVLTIMTAVLVFLCVLSMLLANYLDRGNMLKELADIFSILFIFAAAGAFIGLLLTLVVNAIKN